VGEAYTCASGGAIAGGRRLYGALGAFIAALAPGTWSEYTGTNLNTPLDGADSPADGPFSSLESAANYPLTNWSNKFFFDPITKLIGGIGTAQGYTGEAPAGAHGKCVWFDLAANAFSQDWSPTGDNQGHVYDGNVSRPLNGYVYRRGFGATKIYRCAVATKVWELSTLSHTGVYAYDACGLEVFPDWGSQGSLLMLGGAAGTGYLYRWDLATGTRTALGSYAVGDYPVIVYIPALQACVFGGGAAGSGLLYKIDSAGSITQIATTLPVGVSSASSGPLLADPSGQALMWKLSTTDNKLRSFNPTTGDWIDKGAVIAGLSGDIANTVGIALTGLGALAFLHGRGRVSGASTHKFWIYKV
jgi:hypothetical protein